MPRWPERGDKGWQLFFQRIGVPVIGILVSKLSGTGSVKKKEIYRSNVIGLSRKPVTDESYHKPCSIDQTKLNLRS